MSTRSMLAVAYWSRRPEARDKAAFRLADFLARLRELSSSFESWYEKGRTKADAKRHVMTTDAEGLAQRLRSNHGDFDDQPIRELGFRFSAWNGKNASLTATIGADFAQVSNSVVLSLDEEGAPLGSETWRQVLDALVEGFAPDDAAIVNDGRRAHARVDDPLEYAWFRYERDGGTTEYPERG